MVQVAPPRCKFISASISCKLWVKRYAPPRYSTLNRLKIQRVKLNMHPWRNWQTRMVQVHIFERKCRFNSCRVHQTKIIRTLLRLEMGSDLSIISNILTLTAKSINTLFMRFESRQRAYTYTLCLDSCYILIISLILFFPLLFPLLIFPIAFLESLPEFAFSPQPEQINKAEIIIKASIFCELLFFIYFIFHSSVYYSCSTVFSAFYKECKNL